MDNDREYAESFWKNPDKRETKLFRFILSRQGVLRELLQSEISRYYARLPRGYLNREEISNLHMRLKKQRKKQHYTGYTAMYADYIEKKKKIPGQEALFLFLLICYADYMDEITEEYIETAKITYEDIFEFTRIETETEFSTSRYSFDENEIIPARGVSYRNMVDAHSQFRMQKILEMAMRNSAADKETDLSSGEGRDILEKTLSEVLGVSPNGNFKGILDVGLKNVTGLARLKALEKAGIEEVKFIAVLDNATTDECRQLNGLTFKVSKLSIGKNMPPIYPPPHPCRSVVKAIIPKQYSQRRL